MSSKLLRDDNFWEFVLKTDSFLEQIGEVLNCF